MNQIPNIEETHNTREELIKVYYKDFNHYSDIDVKFEDVYEFIHHQLQKARGEERERIEAIFKEHVPPHAMDLEDSVWLKRLLNKAFGHD
jgi:dTDP-4-amino-4,6-dideoxygalactose transaminase